jgi:hypothetical protein
LYWIIRGYDGIRTNAACAVRTKQQRDQRSRSDNSNAPVAGRNSFTEGQAKSKIEDAGYTNVTELKKDDNGIWRGKATKSGSSTAVSIDFQGNVNTGK